MIFKLSYHCNKIAIFPFQGHLAMAIRGKNTACKVFSKPCVLSVGMIIATIITAALISRSI